MKIFGTISFIIIFNFFSFAQHQNIQISSSNAPEEPSIYVNPNNTDHILGGANIKNQYYSNDGGYTWNSNILSSSYNVWGDPCVITDTANNFYFFHLSWPSFGSFIDRIVCQKSIDGGISWNDGSYMGLDGTKGQDKEWAVVDRTNNNLYVTWTQFDDYDSSDPDDISIIRFSKSTDEGETWSEPVKINEVDGDCIDSDNTVEGAVPAVGPEGEIYVAWAGPAGLVFNRSLDQGETWLDEDIFVDEFPGGWDYNIPGISRCNGLPVTVCDLSGGPNHGTIYINWSDQRNGEDDTDIWLKKSTDGGNTWSEIIRVNNDPPGKQQFFTWMSIDQATGYLWFVWYDRRNYDDDNTDVYMAVSKDGGETIQNFIVSEEPFLPWSNIFFGDYNNVSSHDNIVRPIWTRLQNGSLSVLTAIIDVDAITTDVAEQEVMPFASLEPNYPNPFKQSTYISFKLKQPGNVTLKVFDMFGREVVALINNELIQPGKYVEHFETSNFDLSPGIYYFALEGEGINLRRKMMLLR